MNSKTNQPGPIRDAPIASAQFDAAASTGHPCHAQVASGAGAPFPQTTMFPGAAEVRLPSWIVPQPGGGTLVNFSHPDAVQSVPSIPPRSLQPFPIHCLPLPARAIAEEVARVFTLPYDISGSITLAVAAAVLGKWLQLECPPHQVRPNLTILIIAPSGTGKSAVFKAICAPIYNAEKDRIEKHKLKRPTLCAKKECLEHQAEAFRKFKDPGDETKLADIKRQLEKLELEMATPRLLAEDVTVQKLAVMLYENNETIAVFSPDAGDFISNLYGRFNGKGERPDDNIYLKVFSGDPHRQDRVGRDPIILQSPCGTLLLLMTPDSAAELFTKNRFMVGGFLPRCLLCDSAAVPQRDDGTPRVINPDTTLAWHTTIVTLLDEFHDRKEPAVVKLTPTAAGVFQAFHNEYFVDCFKSIEKYASFFARHGELAKRIALVIHALIHGRAAPNHLLDESTARAGVELMVWFAAHQARRLNVATVDKDQTDLAKITKLIQKGDSAFGIPGPTLTLRRLKQNHGFEEERIRELAARYPAQLAIGETQPGSAGGRPATVAYLPPGTDGSAGNADNGNKK